MTLGAAATAPLGAVDGIEGWLTERYEHFHAHPELSMQEHATADAVAAHLAEFGFEVLRLGGGVVGILRNGAGRTLLYRADMDALPIAETTGLPYASTATQKDREGEVRPVMHACGHDVHITVGLGVARMLAEHRDAWAGTYLALFQPGEETAEGARSMLDADLVDAVPRPDAAVGQHVLGFRAGTVGLRPGRFLSTARSLEIVVHGAGTHGSMPHLGVDPVLTAASIVVRLQGVVAREIAPAEFGVVTVGALQAGTQANVIPDDARLLLNFRAYSEETMTLMTRAVERIVRGECAAAGCPADPEFRYYSRFPLTDNDPDLTASLRAAMTAHFGPERVCEIEPQTASEDFSVVPRAFGIPYVYWGLGGFGDDQAIVPNHNPAFAPTPDPTLRTGVEAGLVAALTQLSAPTVH